MLGKKFRGYLPESLGELLSKIFLHRYLLIIYSNIIHCFLARTRCQFISESRHFLHHGIIRYALIQNK